MLYLGSKQEGVIYLDEKKRHSTAANVLYLLRHVTRVDRTYLMVLAATLAVSWSRQLGVHIFNHRHKADMNWK